MTVGSFPAPRDMTCIRCKHEIRAGEEAWFTKGKRGYWCRGCQDDWIAQNKGSQYATETTTTSTAPYWEKIATMTAPQSPTPEDSRQSSIEKAHRENLDSARQTRDVLANLTVAIVTLRDAIKEAKR